MHTRRILNPIGITGVWSNITATKAPISQSNGP